MAEITTQDQRKQTIFNAFKYVNDFPKPGVKFLDIMPIFASPQVFTTTIDAFAHQLEGVEFDAITGLEVRGLLIGNPLAYKLKKPFIPIRKKGKLPGEVHNIKYDLEYGQDAIEIQKGIIKPGQKVVIIDDVLATGGTISAAVKLIELSEAQIAKIVFLADVPVLNGLLKLNNIPAQRISILTHVE